MTRKILYPDAFPLLQDFRLNTSKGDKTNSPLTQEDIAEKLVEYEAYPLGGMPSNDTISKWENGISRPRKQNIFVKLLKILVDHDGVNTVEEANQLFRAFWDRDLRENEIKDVNPDWLVTQKVVARRSPFPGLRPFTEDDSEYFYGRSLETKDLFERVSNQKLVTVFGPSGIGKSSLFYAGLVPKLRVHPNWLTVTFRPKNQPYQSLSEALASSEVWPNKSLDEILKVTSEKTLPQYTLKRILKMCLEDNQQKSVLLLIIDQFEELLHFEKTTTQSQFLEQLADLIQDDNTDEIKLLLSIREDFFVDALKTSIGKQISNNSMYLYPMGSNELKEAITQPAKQVDLELEPEVVKAILNDLDNGSTNKYGQLPLTQFTLSMLFEKTIDGKITLEAYNGIGGVNGAVTDYAEQVFTDLDEEEQKQAYRLFRDHLINRTVDVRPTRQITSRKDVEEAGIHWDLIEKLAKERLIIVSENPRSRDSSVEIIHEALIFHWKRLSDWMVEDAEFYTWLVRLKRNIEQWEEVNRDQSALLRGELLTRSVNWLSDRSSSLKPEHIEYIEASKSWEEEEKEKTKQKLVDTKRLSSQKTRRSYMLGAFGGGLGFAMFFSLPALFNVILNSRYDILSLLFGFYSVLLFLGGVIIGGVFKYIVDELYERFSGVWRQRLVGGLIGGVILSIGIGYAVYALTTIFFSNLTTSIFNIWIGLIAIVFGFIIGSGYIWLRQREKTHYQQVIVLSILIGLVFGFSLWFYMQQNESLSVQVLQGEDFSNFILALIFGNAVFNIFFFCFSLMGERKE